jgi:hypothetical protein
VSDVLTLADIDRLRAAIKPMRFPFMVPGFGYPGGAVLVVATDEQIAQAERDGFLRVPGSVTDESDAT